MPTKKDAMTSFGDLLENVLLMVKAKRRLTGMGPPPESSEKIYELVEKSSQKCQVMLVLGGCQSDYQNVTDATKFTYSRAITTELE